MNLGLLEDDKKRKTPTYRNAAFLLRRLQAMYGDDFHPILKNAENATELQSIADTIAKDRKAIGDTDHGGLKELMGQEIMARKAASEVWDKVAPYLQPKLKQIEVVEDKSNPYDSLTQEDRTSLLEKLNDSIN